MATNSETPFGLNSRNSELSRTSLKECTTPEQRELIVATHRIVKEYIAAVTDEKRRKTKMILKDGERPKDMQKAPCKCTTPIPLPHSA